MSFEWKSILGTLAPTLATALGGPLAGTATKFLANALLGDENADDAAISMALQGATPADLAKLKEIDASFKVEMKRLDIDLVKIGNQDRDSARGLFKVNMWPQISLSAMFILGYFIILYSLISGAIVIAPLIKDTIILLLGILTREVPTIMQFWFGSSNGSKTKSYKLNGV